jgi:hypothetical protein
MSRLTVLVLLAGLVTPAWATPASAQVKCADDLAAPDNAAESRMSAREFVQRVTARETTIARALGNFDYTVDATVQTLTGDTVDGEFHQVATVTLGANGPQRKVADGAVNTLTRIKFAERDIDSLRDALILTPDRMAMGDIALSGRQRMGDFNASLFDIMPRDPAADPHGFQGRVWVRAREDAVMRLCGRSGFTPIAPMRFQVIRVLVDEQYWFPVSIRADEEARVDGKPVRVRVNVVYADYYKAR